MAISRDNTKAATLSLAQLIRHLAGSGVRLHLVTEGATAGHSENSHLDVAAAAVWALGRSLITEGAVAISGMTDLETGTDLSVALSQIGADLEIGGEGGGLARRAPVRTPLEAKARSEPFQNEPSLQTKSKVMRCRLRIMPGSKR